MKIFFKSGSIYILMMIFSLISCNTDTSTIYKYPPYEIKGDTDFNDVIIYQTKEEKFKIETGKIEKTSSRGPYATRLKIKSIEISDTLNFSIDSSDTDFKLKENEDTEFKVIFHPQYFGTIKADIKIEFEKDDDVGTSLKDWEKEVKGKGVLF